MNGTKDLLTQRNAQEQISVSEQQLDAYRQHGVSEYSDERMAEGEQKKEEARARRQAERLRLRFAGLGETVEEPEESVSNANAGEQAVSAPQEMSERQKKKRDKRREKTLRRSRKQYGPGATENTLPMARRVAEYHKEREKAGEDGPENLETVLYESNTTYLEGAFRKLIDVPGGSEAFISELKEHMEKNRRLKRSLSLYDALPASTLHNISPLRRARMEEVRSAQVNFEGMLRLSLAANGVDFDTGGPMSQEVTKWAKERLVAEHEKYKKSFELAREATAENLAGDMEEMVRDKLQAPAFQQDIAEAKDAVSESTGIDFNAFPVTYGPYITIKYGEYQGLRNAIDRNPDKYGENKDLVDRMMTELLDVWDRMSKEDLFLTAAEDVRQDLRENEPSAYAASRLLLFMGKWREERVEPLEYRFGILRKGMHFLLEGRDIDGEDSSFAHAQLESEFGIVTDRRRAEREKLAEANVRLVPIEELGGKAEMADLYTADTILIARELQAHQRRLDNAVQDFCPEGVWVDRRAMRVFFRGYEVNEKGEPKTAEDAANKEADEAFARAFASRDQKKPEDEAPMAPYLDRMVDEFLSAELNADMMEADYVREHALQMRIFTDRAGYMENMRRMVPQYFARLPEERLKRLDAAQKAWVYYSAVLHEALVVEGVLGNTGELADRGLIAIMREMQPEKRAVFAEMMENRRRERIRNLGGTEAMSALYSDESLRICEDLTEERQRRKNSMNELAPDRDELKRLGRDDRTMEIYIRGYEKGKDGEPLTEADRQNKEADALFVREYLSSDLDARARQLDRITDELAAIELNEDMLSDDYILANAAQLRLWALKLCYLQNLRTDNPAYFANLPADKEARLRVAVPYVPYTSFFMGVLASHGINSHTGNLVNNDMQLEVAEMERKVARPMFMKQLKEYRDSLAGSGAGSAGNA